MQKHSGEVVVLGYGSLLHIDSLQRTLPAVSSEQLRPVYVRGYRRIFNLIMRGLIDRSLAIGGQEIAALNAVVETDGHMGGVAFVLGDSQLEALNAREFCYRQISGVQAYDFATDEPVGEVVFYSVYSAGELKAKLPNFYRDMVKSFGIDGLQHAEILPADNYLSLCLQGAYSWGDAFGDHFVEHTYLADGQKPLVHYLDRREIKRRLDLDLSCYIKSR